MADDWTRAVVADWLDLAADVMRSLIGAAVNAAALSTPFVRARHFLVRHRKL